MKAGNSCTHTLATCNRGIKPLRSYVHGVDILILENWRLNQGQILSRDIPTGVYVGEKKLGNLFHYLQAKIRRKKKNLRGKKKIEKFLELNWKRAEWVQNPCGSGSKKQRIPEEGPADVTSVRPMSPTWCSRKL